MTRSILYGRNYGQAKPVGTIAESVVSVKGRITARSARRICSTSRRTGFIMKSIK